MSGFGGGEFEMWERGEKKERSSGVIEIEN